MVVPCISAYMLLPWAMHEYRPYPVGKSRRILAGHKLASLYIIIIIIIMLAGIYYCVSGWVFWIAS